MDQNIFIVEEGKEDIVDVAPNPNMPSAPLESPLDQVMPMETDDLWCQGRMSRPNGHDLGITPEPPSMSDERANQSSTSFPLDDRSVKKPRHREDETLPEKLTQEPQVTLESVRPPPQPAPLPGINVPHPMNFREKFFGGKLLVFFDLFGEEEEIPNLDEDVILIRKGPIQKVVVHDRVEELLTKRWKNVVVVKLMGQTITLAQLQYRLERMWQNKDGFMVVDMDCGFFNVSFVNSADVKMVMTKGPWLIENSYLHTQIWTNTFDAKIAKVRFMLVWIQLVIGVGVGPMTITSAKVRIGPTRTSSHWPMHHYNNSFLRRVGQLDGKVIHIDHQIDAKTRKICKAGGGTGSHQAITFEV
ncbi:OLC1v1036846C1 [Oldenlandia corymbosa var. corymbosa]|uniref:OLC1v1036846C1 n=1 Tax=Oldenlandia corymbosa var. corymbosa TaxID=529605 RepID=A0AAV1CX64_OLDCO|nr:OLC1v1036846C1 [Oldenlandia corymbosa var. corymbosa]